MSKYDFEEELSDSDNDDLLREEIQALSRACIPSTTSNLADGRNLDPSTTFPRAGDGDFSYDDDDNDDDDLELVRNIKEQYGFAADINNPLSLKPLTSLPPVTSDDDEDDFETLEAIKQRFSHFSGDTTKIENYSCIRNLRLNDTFGMSSGNENLDLTKYEDDQDSGGIAKDGDASNHTSSFPKAAQTFVEAIKKNRSCQKFIRSKMIHIEARMEEIKELQKRVKTLREFQVQCKKKIGRALSQKQDARILLLSASKRRANVKGNDKYVSALGYGPPENSHVACYRNASTNFPLSFQREKWCKEEKENLEKGIIQQFQEMLLKKSADVLSTREEPGYANGLDGIISSINNIDITPEIIQDFSGKVNWEQLASMYAPRRSGAECESRWLNYENRLINRDNWTTMEDKQLLLGIQDCGINNWSFLAEKLKTKRTPFQCLARYQRSLNASILKRDWTDDEDAQLRSAVESYGESNWQAVASALEGRTGTQCSNRWNKTLHPARKRVGKWSDDEDKRLKVAVTLFGHKSWNRISQFVPGRTQAQCRERWVNVLDPSLNRGEWTEEDDVKLKHAILDHGYCWSRIAACVSPRTDNQCRRRWKKLYPHEVPLLRAARNIQKAALISNFVDRESERPALGPNDFVPLPIEDSSNELENNIVPSKRKKSRRSGKSDPNKEIAACCTLKEVKSRKCRKRARSPEVNMATDCGDAGNGNGDDIVRNKKRMISKPGSKENNSSANVDIAIEPNTKSSRCKKSDATGQTGSRCRDVPLRIRSRRPRGVRSKEIPSGGCSQDQATGTYHTNVDSYAYMSGSEENNAPEMLHDHSACPYFPFRISDDKDVQVSNMDMREQISPELQPGSSLTEITLGDSCCVATGLETSANDGTETHGVDVVGLGETDIPDKDHKQRKLHLDQFEWEDSPLAVLFCETVRRIQRRKSNKSLGGG